MPLCTPPAPPRRDGLAPDHRFWLPELAVAMDEGREGGRPGSPGGPVTPSTRPPVELRFCSVVMAAVSNPQAQSLSLQAA